MGFQGLRRRPAPNEGTGLRSFRMERTFQSATPNAGSSGGPFLMSKAVAISVSLFHLATGGLIAQDESEWTPRVLEKETEGRLPFGEREPMAGADLDDSMVLVPKLAGIKLTGSGSGARVKDEPSGRPGRIEAVGLTVDYAGLMEALGPFLGAPLTERGLDRLIETVLRYYESEDRPVTDIVAPEQDLADGKIELVIIDGVVGSVAMQSGGIFNDELLSGAIHLQRGEILLSSELQKHLDWFNRNPFRPAALYAAPGQAEGEADLVFALSERRPWRMYAGYENSGAEVAGEHRFLTGFNWGNALGRDMLLSYQFTSAESPGELSAHALSMEIPFHSRHQFLRFNGSWADILTEGYLAGILLESSGSSWQLGASYGFQWNRWLDFRQEASIGVEFKSSDNFLVYGGILGGSGAGVEVVQLRADYRATRQFKQRGSLAVSAAVVGSPGRLSAENSSENFRQFRPGAEASYLYGRARAAWTRRLPGAWALWARGKFQVATGALLPTEQLAIGGHASVRGFGEREYLADQGYLLSAEIRAPAMRLPVGGEVQFLGFLDHGRGWRDETGQGGSGETEVLSSVGAGLRLQLGKHLKLRADLGAPLAGGGGSRAHLGLTGSF